MTTLTLDLATPFAAIENVRQSVSVYLPVIEINAGVITVSNLPTLPSMQDVTTYITSLVNNLIADATVFFNDITYTLAYLAHPDVIFNTLCSLFCTAITGIVYLAGASWIIIIFDLICTIIAWAATLVQAHELVNLNRMTAATFAANPKLDELLDKVEAKIKARAIKVPSA